MLEGKARIDFEKWFLKDMELSEDFEKIAELIQFYEFPVACKYGIFVDFFDEVGISVESYREHYVNDKNHFKSYVNGIITCFSSRHDARLDSIKKASEEYNKNHK